MALSFRKGAASVFVNLNTREDDRYNGLQAGFTTYHTPDDSDEEQATTTYVEMGGRCDHIANPLMDACNVDYTVELTADSLDKPYITAPTADDVAKPIAAAETQTIKVTAVSEPQLATA